MSNSRPFSGAWVKRDGEWFYTANPHQQPSAAPLAVSEPLPEPPPPKQRAKSKSKAKAPKAEPTPATEPFIEAMIEALPETPPELPELPEPAIAKKARVRKPRPSRAKPKLVVEVAAPVSEPVAEPVAEPASSSPDDNANQFVCSDCGKEVWSVPRRDPPPERCALCNWLQETIADPVEREVLRQKFTNEVKA